MCFEGGRRLDVTTRFRRAPRALRVCVTQRVAWRSPSAHRVAPGTMGNAVMVKDRCTDRRRKFLYRPDLVSALLYRSSGGSARSISLALARSPAAFYTACPYGRKSRRVSGTTVSPVFVGLIFAGLFFAARDRQQLSCENSDVRLVVVHFWTCVTKNWRYIFY